MPCCFYGKHLNGSSYPLSIIILAQLFSFGKLNTAKKIIQQKTSVSQILIFSTYRTNRLLYVLDFIFKGFTNISFTVTDDETIFKQLAGGKINYSDKPLCATEIQILPNGLLEEDSHRRVKPSVEWQNKIPYFFLVQPLENTTCLSFDIFSAIFFMLSRYEEYNSPAKDSFGRFPAKDSLGSKNNFLQLPVVDIWLKNFLLLITTTYPNIIFPERKMKINFTYDIDVAFAYKGRSFVRQLGAIGKDLLQIKFGRLWERTLVLCGFKKDPFDKYDYIMKSSINPIFFFLLHQKLSPQDRNIHPKTMLLRNVIKHVQQRVPIGIHPSFHSSVKASLLQAEKKTLEQISGIPITKSRQHYLRFNWPKTYQQLAQNGILEEYSMGFTQTPGFRAGTCTPFYFFDLDKNETTEMKIFPLCIMESTFRDHMTMPVQIALSEFIQYFEAVKSVQGHFICIWHNDTLRANGDESDPKNFRWLHEQMIGYVIQYHQKSIVNGES